jgi:uncharacterized RDD family membrane protein YckC
VATAYDDYPMKEKRKNDELRADFGIRFGAYLLDSFILSFGIVVLMLVLVAIFWIPISGFMDRMVAETVTEDEIVMMMLPIQCGAYILAFLIQFLYYCLLPARWNGQTIGKRLLNIRIVPTDGGENTLGRMLLRNVLGYYISGYVLYLGFLWMIWDEDKQGWHDKIANTAVIRD